MNGVFIALIAMSFAVFFMALANIRRAKANKTWDDRCAGRKPPFDESVVSINTDEPIQIRKPHEYRFEEVEASTLHITHIFDGEEVVCGAEDGQVWIGTFASTVSAERFIEWNKRANLTVRGLRRHAV